MTNPPARITLAIGSERVLVDRAVSSVSTAVRRIDPSLQRYDIAANDEGAAAALREATAPNLFGDGAVVVLAGIDQADDRLADAVRQTVADLPDSVYLVVTHPGGVKGKALLDALRAAGAVQVDCQAVKGRAKALDFLAKEFAAHRRKATQDALVSLYESIGHDLGLLTGAVSQLCSDVEANPLQADDVREYFAGVADVSGFTISDAVWNRQYVEAMRALRMSMMAHDQGRVGPMTISALATGLRSLVRVGGMPPGASEGDVAKEAGVPPWKVAALRRQWARWSGDQRRLAAAVVALAEADGAVKGGVREGSSLDAEQKLLALEVLVATTAAPHGP